MTTVPTPQAVTAWKKKADTLVEVRREIATATATLENELAPIRAKHEPDLLKLAKREKELTAEVVSFGKEHADTVFADGATVETKQAKILGKGTDGTVTVSDGFEPKAVIANLNEDRGLKKFLKVALSLDAVGLKNAFKNGGKEQVEKLTAAGLEYAPGFSVTVKGKEA